MRVERFLLVLVLLGGLLWSSPGFGAQKLISVILPADLEHYRTAHQAFMTTLQAGGFGQDKAQVFVQTPNPDPMSLANSVRKAVGVGADVIITYGDAATLVAKKGAGKIPVLFAEVYDPVTLGIVKDLAAPGGDISGASCKVPLEDLLRKAAELIPMQTMGVLYTSGEGGSALQTRELETLARPLGLAVLKQEVKGKAELPGALNALAARVQCLFLTESTVVAGNRQEILDFAAGRSLPVISPIPGLAEQGALVTLVADPEEQGKLAAVHALQVLMGQKVHFLPVRTPKKVALVVNLKAAGKMHLQVPVKALAGGLEVIR